MLIRRVCALMALCLFVALPALTEPALPGPELPKMSNLAFGWVSMSGIDPTLDMVTAFAPTMLVIQDAGYKTGGEAVYGQFDFSGFKVNENFESGITTVGPGLFRICHYGYNSNTAEVAGMQMPGVLMHTSGDAIELSYAQRFGNTNIGLSIVPQDSSSVALKTDGMTLATGNTKTDFGGRIGAVTRLPYNIRIGGDYSYQEDSGTLTYNPALVPGVPPLTGDFVTRCGTIGASWKPSKTTTLYGAYQKITAKGDGIGRRDAELNWAGIQQQLSKDVLVRANYLAGGQNYSVQYTTRIGVFNVAYTHNALLNARDILGKGDSKFIAWAFAL